MNDIDKILEKAGEADSIELKIFQNAVIKTLSAYQSDPTKANKANLDAAKDALENKKKELAQKYFKSENHGNCFPSTLQVMTHLYEAGYKISDSKIYRDKKAGLLKVNLDGSVDEAEVRAYAAGLKRRDGNIDDLSDLQARKSDKEVKILEIKEQQMQFDLDKSMGKYIPRSDFDAELAARAVVFESGFRHFFATRAREMIVTVGGKAEKTADLLELLNQGLNEQLNTYASTDVFQVLFDENF